MCIRDSHLREPFGWVAFLLNTPLAEPVGSGGSHYGPDQKIEKASNAFSCKLRARCFPTEDVQHSCTHHQVEEESEGENVSLIGEFQIGN